MNIEPIVIHIGHHKSGTTYLRERVFPKISANHIVPTKSIFRLVSSGEHFEKEALTQWVHDEIERKYGQNKYELTILSHEALSGHPTGYNTIDPFMIADNLKQAFPNAKILLTIRRQFDYLLSLYTFRVAIKGYELRGLTKFLQEEGTSGLFEKLEYDRLVEYYMSLFGRAHVLVLPLELLKMNPESFHEKIAAFLEVSSIPFKQNKIVNESTKLRPVLFLWRCINVLFAGLMRFLLFLPIETDPEYPFRTLRYKFYRFKKRATRHLNRIFSSSQKLSFPLEFDGRRLLARYAESNKRLHKLTNLDLKGLEYPYEL